MISSRLLAGAAASTSRRAVNATGVCVPAVRAFSQRLQSRHYHSRLELPYNIEEGLGEFLPPQALKVVAVEYQQGLLDRLNEEVAETGEERKSVAQTVIDAARDPSKVLMYNYASEALNNSFFLTCLRPLPEGETSHEASIQPDLMQAIRHDFGSLDQLKSTFSAAVQGMFNPGWVWLLMDQKGSLAVYPTFGQGTLLIQSRQFLPSEAKTRYSSRVIGEEDSSILAPLSPSFGVSNPVTGKTSSPTQAPSDPSRQKRTFFTTPVSEAEDGQSRFASQSLFNPPPPQTDVTRAGDRLFPLFCVSVHEHAWMSAGYGVWGKEEWMKKFWTVVNWTQASEHFKQYASYGKRRPHSV